MQIVIITCENDLHLCQHLLELGIGKVLTFRVEAFEYKNENFSCSFRRICFDRDFTARSGFYLISYRTKAARRIETKSRIILIIYFALRFIPSVLCKLRQIRWKIRLLLNLYLFYEFLFRVVVV